MTGSMLRPLLFALRRLRHRPLQLGLLVVALAAAGGVVAASSIVGALALGSSVHERIASAPASAKAVEVEYRLTSGGRGNGSGETAARMLSRFEAVTSRPARVQVFDPVAPADQRGVRLVVATGSGVRVSSGRPARGCHGKICDGVALGNQLRLGQLLGLGGGVRLRIVGLGSLSEAALPDQSLLAGKAVAVPAVAGTPLAAAEAGSGSTVSRATLLVPGRVQASQLDRLAGRLRVAAVRLQRADSSLSVSTPAPLLRQLAELGAAAKNRLLIVSSEGAALLLAFAAFVAALRRRELERLRLQLETLGGSRRQLTLVRAVEVVLPALVALVLVLAGARIALVPLQATRNLGGGFVGEALPLRMLLSVIGLEVIGALILFASAVPVVRRRFGGGPLELAALTALAVIVWQAVSTGGLDPSQIAGGAGGLPVLLLTPALTVLTAGIVLLRLLPLVFRLAERLARRAPAGLRLALLAAARNPGQAAATTTFLAVALGSALFSLNYRATLEQQASAAAAFQAGAAARATGGAASGAVPTLLGHRSAATPALRLSGSIQQQAGTAQQQPLTVLALPASEIPQVDGWKSSFSQLSRASIARRLRSNPVTLAGPTLPPEATAVRLWARSSSPAQRSVVLHVLTPGGGFTSLPLGRLGPHWRLLEAQLPPEPVGTELIGVEFPLSAGSSGGVIVQPGGITGNVTQSTAAVDFGGLATQVDGIWKPLPSLAGWTGANAPDFQGTLVSQSFASAPISTGLRFQLDGTAVPLVRPTLPLRTAAGSSEYELPALLGSSAAAAAVDDQLTVTVLGQQIRLRSIGRASLFPTITSTPSSFAVVDYQTLFATLNADQPGLAPPDEAWFDQPPAHALPAGAVQVLRLAAERQRLLDDPLAAGTRRLLTWSGYAAAALALLGLLLSVRLALAGERQLLAEYEALGVAPRTLGRSVQLRLVFLCLLGLAAALAGAAFAIQIVAALVAVTGSAGRPLPPITTAIAWQSGGALLAAVAAAALLAAVLLTGRSLREATGRRLRQ